MMRNSQETIGNLIDKQRKNTVFHYSICACIKHNSPNSYLLDPGFTTGIPCLHRSQASASQLATSTVQAG